MLLTKLTSLGRRFIYFERTTWKKDLWSNELRQVYMIDWRIIYWCSSNSTHNVLKDFEKGKKNRDERDQETWDIQSKASFKTLTGDSFIINLSQLSLTGNRNTIHDALFYPSLTKRTSYYVMNTYSRMRPFRMLTLQNSISRINCDDIFNGDKGRKISSGTR